MDVQWSPPQDSGSSPIVEYEVGIWDGTTTEWETTTETDAHRVVGLVDGAVYGFSVRATNSAGTGPPSLQVTATPAPPGTATVTVGNRLNILDLDRQSQIVRLGPIEVQLIVWWQPLDGHWYASIDVPVNTRIVSGRRMVVGAGLLDRLGNTIGGNIVCRPLAEDYIFVDPMRNAWREGTHGLFWEPAA